MTEAILSALLTLLTPIHLAYLGGGVALGLVIGILPGLGGIAGLSLMLPFLYGMEQTTALAMLIGLVAVIPTSDTFTSVLMGIPGSSAAQATILDGFPLAKRGQAARALGAAFTASLFGGLFGAVILTVFVLIARPVILLFGSAELFMLGLLGLSMVGVLSGSSLPKGLAAAALGLLLGSVGAAPATGEYRMSFDIDYLTDGIPLVVVGLAIFAVPEIIDLLRQNRSIAEKTGLGQGWLQGIKETWIHRWIVLRCAGIGAIVGFLPGLGGSVVDWIAYGHVVQTTKDRENFGKGDIRGVLAPESAANAKEGGALIPTLLFGIPGSGGMAVFLGGMVLLGIEAGPGMVEENLNLTYVIIWSLAIANVLGAGTCLLIAKPVAKLADISYTLLAPFMIMVICFAAFQATRDFGDMFALLAVGLLGVYMRRFGWPRPAFLIGFVLAPTVETYLYQAVQFYEWRFLLRPGVIVIALITAVSVYFGAKYQPHGKVEVDLRLAQPRILWPQAIFASLLVLTGAAALWDSSRQSFLGAVFPAGVAVVTVAAALLVLWPLVTGRIHNPANHDEEITGDHVGLPGSVGLLHYLWWIIGLVAGCFAVGFVIAITVFFVLFLRAVAGTTWAKAAFLTACAVGFMVTLAHTMTLDFPAGLLQAYVDLPWPIR